jgi:hypothetical protein
MQDNREKMAQLQFLNKQLQDNIKSLNDQLKKKELFINAEGTKDFKMSIGPESNNDRKRI